jgi:hypothetical protein
MLTAFGTDMNGKIKLHKVTGPAFNPGEEWVGSGGIRCWIVSVRKYPGAMSDHVSDYGVTYRYSDGAQSEKDAWNFQVRYRHVADFKLKVAKQVTCDANI